MLWFIVWGKAHNVVVRYCPNAQKIAYPSPLSVVLIWPVPAHDNYNEHSELYHFETTDVGSISRRGDRRGTRLWRDKLLNFKSCPPGSLSAMHFVARKVFHDTSFVIMNILSLSLLVESLLLSSSLQLTQLRFKLLSKPSLKICWQICHSVGFSCLAR